MKTPFPFRRAVGDILVAALAASIVLSASFGIFGLFVFPIVYFLTAVIGALMALPLYWLLHRMGIARGWMAPPAGLLAGIVGGLTFWWRLRPSSPPAAQ